MKGGVQWYLYDESGVRADDALRACDRRGVWLANPSNGRVSYLDDAPGREGDQVFVTVEGLFSTVAHALVAGTPIAVQLWASSDRDVVCTLRSAPTWSSFLLEFSFDGHMPADASEVAQRLMAAHLDMSGATAAWLLDTTGLAEEYGAMHEWDGTQRPAWPPPDLRGGD